MKTHALIFTLSMLMVPAVGIAQEAPHQGMGMPKNGEDGPDKAFTAANDKMMKDMDMKPTGNADHDFVSMMIPHHQGAIDMAQIELQYGKDPILRKMAQDIIEAQAREIVEFKTWMSKNK